MLRRLDIKTVHRSLAPGFWPNAVPFGKRTVIYGHNGSGKSTLSHLLHEVAIGNAPVEVIWDDGSGGSARRIAIGSGIPGTPMSVFTKEWVQRNLSQFLDGQSASAIVTLGEEAIGAKEQEKDLEEEIEKLGKEAKEADGKRKELARKIEALARDAQEAISSQLRPFDYERFSKNRWSVTKVKEQLNSYSGAFPDQNKHAEALVRLGEGALAPVPKIKTPTVGIEDALERLSTLVGETPTRIALATLEGNAHAQHWVEQGIGLHEGVENCLFCSGPLSDARRDQLAKHFDESWLDLRARARGVADNVRTYSSQLQSWLKDLPATDALASGLRDTYSAQVEAITEEIGSRVQLLAQVEAIAEEKQNDPSTTPGIPDWSSLTGKLKTAAIEGAVGKHNEEASAHAERTEQHIQVVLDHLLGVSSDAYRKLNEQLAAAIDKYDTTSQAHQLAGRTLNETRQKKFSSSKMAETLTKDLARVYGKNHLTVVVTSDGRSYACRRDNQAATNLSDGERTTLSLLYFLRKLEDETDATDPTQRIVVVDDPSSSLDREAVFATHQWLIDTLEKFGQFVVLTHDFNLLRLFIKSQNNRWSRSIKKQAEGDKAEKTFPSVAFLEMFTAAGEGARTSKIDPLPQLLKNNVSEYAYLFGMVMKGIGEDVDTERLFLLPNAARRVLEVFCSYKAPHLPNFDAQLRSLIDAEGTSPEPYRDVYDFCNRYSHGEGAEVVDVLDARAVHQQIRRCMEFLKDRDGEHFERMCKATNCENSLA